MQDDLSAGHIRNMSHARAIVTAIIAATTSTHTSRPRGTVSFSRFIADIRTYMRKNRDPQDKLFQENFGPSPADLHTMGPDHMVRIKRLLSIPE